MIAPDRIRFDEPHSGLQRLAAHFAGHAYDLPGHETYAVGLMIRGVQVLHYRGARRASRAGQVIVLHPDEARAVTPAVKPHKVPRLIGPPNAPATSLWPMQPALLPRRSWRI